MWALAELKHAPLHEPLPATAQSGLYMYTGNIQKMPLLQCAQEVASDPAYQPFKAACCLKWRLLALRVSRLSPAFAIAAHVLTSTEAGRSHKPLCAHSAAVLFCRSCNGQSTIS